MRFLPPRLQASRSKADETTAVPRPKADCVRSQFAAVEALLLRPLPYGELILLVMVWEDTLLRRLPAQHAGSREL